MSQYGNYSKAIKAQAKSDMEKELDEIFETWNVDMPGGVKDCVF